MKRILVLFTMVLGFAARADYNLDAKHGDFSCSGGGIRSLTLNAERTRLKLIWKGNDTFDFLNITHRNSDGYICRIHGDRPL